MNPNLPNAWLQCPECDSRRTEMEVVNKLGEKYETLGRTLVFRCLECETECDV